MDDDRQAFMFRAMGFGPGGQTDFMGARRSMQKGLSDPANFDKVMQRASMESNEGGQRTLLLERMMEWSQEQAELAQNLYSKRQKGELSDRDLMSKLGETGFKGVKNESIESRALDADFTGLLDVVKGNADVNAKLVNIGESVWKPMHATQESMLRVTEHWLPEVHTAIQGVHAAVLTMERVATGKDGGVTGVFKEAGEFYKETFTEIKNTTVRETQKRAIFDDKILQFIRDTIAGKHPTASPPSPPPPATDKEEKLTESVAKLALHTTNTLDIVRQLGNNGTAAANTPATKPSTISARGR